MRPGGGALDTLLSFVTSQEMGLFLAALRTTLISLRNY
jgi:hypothetical protein